MKFDDQVYLLGIRHHGPGCAHALNNALEEIQPDLVLLEGAVELEQGWQLMAEDGMQPPVAQLIYDPKDPSRASFYPWGEFSPEWQAMAYCHRQQVPLQMMDLPAGIEFELQAQREQLTEDAEQESHNLELDSDQATKEDDQAEAAQSSSDLQAIFESPLDRVVKAAGYSDSESWWDATVEHQQGGLETFAAIAELMTSARDAEQEKQAQAKLEEVSQPDHDRTELREAHMRKMLRAARKTHQRIAVVCGAWHVPALAANVKVKDDNALLKGLKKRKVEVAWVPYTFERFGFRSGYRAGIDSPGWYQHLYQHLPEGSDTLTINWMIKIAHLLREQGYGCSSAHVIEAVRLAQQLAKLRGLSIPSLGETMDAAKAVMTEGEPAPLKVIHRDLIVGNKLGFIPESVPQLPIEQDLMALIKRLRLKQDAKIQPLTLDLRKDSGLQRSQLLHQLNLLGIGWGQPLGNSGTGTFKEEWTLQWQPEFSLALIDASTLGNTIAAAAKAAIQKRIQQADSVTELAKLLDMIQLTDLQSAIPTALERLKSMAAVSADLQDLMQALLPLVQVSRYGSVRKVSSDGIEQILASMIIRICNGLASACVSLDQDAAYNMLKAMDLAHSAINMLEQEDFTQRWQTALIELLEHSACHPVLQGRCARILYDSDQLDAEQLSHEFRLTLSEGNEVSEAAAWLEGLLLNGAVLLLFDNKLFEMIDAWINQLAPEDFTRVLPLVRRAFATFSAMELNQLAGQIRFGNNNQKALAMTQDSELAQQALASIADVMGLQKTK